MMQVVKVGAVGIDSQERIVGENVAAMVRNCLDDGKGAKEHGLPRGELRNGVCEDERDDVEEQRLERMAIHGTVGVGDVEEMVAGMNDAVESLVHVAQPVGKIDPGVHYCERDRVLKGWNADVKDQFGEQDFERCDAIVLFRDLPEQVYITSQYLSQNVTGSSDRPGEPFGVDSENPQEHRNKTSRSSDSACPAVDCAGLAFDHHGSFPIAQGQSNGDLHDMVSSNLLQALPPRHVIAFQDIFRGMDAVAVEKIIGIKKVEESTADDVNDSGKDN